MSENDDLRLELNVLRETIRSLGVALHETADRLEAYADPRRDRKSVAQKPANTANRA